MTADLAAPALHPAEPSTPYRARWHSKLLRQRAGLFGLLVVLILVFAAVFAPLIAPYDYAEQDIPNRLHGPSAQHLMGSDHLGRDVLSRLIYGTRTALQTAVLGVLIALLTGATLGMLAAYAGGWIESIVLVITDTFQAFPSILLALALLALIGPSTGSVIFVIAVAFAPGYARVVRAQVLTLKVQPFIEVCRALGAGGLRIISAHILPNILAPLIILLAMDLASAITIEVGLSFLGLGVQPPTPSWGVVLSDGFGRIRQSPWPVLFASVGLALTTLGLTLFGEALRDALDPRITQTVRA
jgi:peptide/nickel transport system permease protein